MDTRMCKVCGKNKDILAFPVRKAPDGVPYRRHTCEKCRAKRRYSRNPDKRKASSRLHWSKYSARRKETKRTLMSAIGQESCAVCGFDKEESLCFHHRDPGSKSFSISYGLDHFYSIEKLKTEAMKCDVLCANCHAVLDHDGTNKDRDALKEELLRHIGQEACSHCGCKNKTVLVFHHLGLQPKKFVISSRMNQRHLEELKKEIRKCQVLCHNCHTAFHA